MKTLTWLRTSAAVLATAFVLTACGTDGDSQKQGEEVPADPHQIALKYAQCMRDNGVDVPDPQPGGEGSSKALQGDDDKVRKALDACSRYAQSKELDRNDPEEKDKRAKQLQCLRDHGIKAEDAPGDGGLGVIDAADPKFEAAAKACGVGAGAPGK